MDNKNSIKKFGAVEGADNRDKNSSNNSNNNSSNNSNKNSSNNNNNIITSSSSINFNPLASSGSSVTHRLADFGRSVFARFSSIQQTSQFIDKGTLTPQEFVDAGDLLVHKFPTWQWQGTTSKRGISWLPPERQYLLTRGVACCRRVRDIEHSLSANVREEADGGWLLPVDDDPEEQTLTDITAAPQQHVDVSTYEAPLNLSADAPPDLKAFADVDSLVQDEDDPAAVSAPSYFVRNVPDADIMHTRTYDLSITYDKYFQSPRLWLFGYNESGIPLTPSEIFEDILTDYAAKTVTVDPHPCTGVPTASIHPCRHAQVMKKVVDNWRAQGIEPRHDLSLIVLLKFISSVIPTIDYDFTMDIDMGLSGSAPVLRRE